MSKKIALIKYLKICLDQGSKESNLIKDIKKYLHKGSKNCLNQRSKKITLIKDLKEVP